jgi:hypothetical protein
MTAADYQALAADVEAATLLVRGTADQARLMGFIPVPTATRDILLPKERP